MEVNVTVGGTTLGCQVPDDMRNPDIGKMIAGNVFVNAYLAEQERVNHEASRSADRMITSTAPTIELAAYRIRAWLEQFSTLGGIDLEVVHTANRDPLLVSDIRALLDAAGVRG